MKYRELNSIFRMEIILIILLNKREARNYTQNKGHPRERQDMVFIDK